MEKKYDFEKDLNKLNEIVSSLEDDDLSLDESLKLYEEGKALISKLEKVLNTAEEKIEKVINTKD